MDPFGASKSHMHRSDSDDTSPLGTHNRSRSLTGYNERGGYDPRYGRMPPLYSGGRHGGRHGGGSCLSRRGRRRLRNWLVMLLIAAAVGFLTWKKLGGLEAGVSRVKDAAIESLLEQMIERGAIRPEMIVPPDAAPKKASAIRVAPQVLASEGGVTGGAAGEEAADNPPMPIERDLTEDDPMDIPLIKRAAPQAAEKLASALLAYSDPQQRAAALAPEEAAGPLSGKGDRHEQDRGMMAGAAAPLEPSLDLQKVLGLSEAGSGLNRLNQQIDELTSKLVAQSRMVEELQRGLESSAKSGVAGRRKEASSDPAVESTPKAADKGGEEFSRRVTFQYAPISTVMCHGTETVDRVCKIKNLCYDPKNDRFFIFKDTGTLELGVPKNRTYLVDTTSIDGHNKFFFDFAEMHPDAFRERTVDMVDKLTFMISRFHALNIMHTIHDDFLGLYGLHRMFAPNDDPDERFPFSRDNHILFLDGFESIRYDYIFQFITNNPLQFRQRLRAERRSSPLPLCFRDAVVGNSKIGSWYSYGFLEPQGPIPNKNVSGLYVRDAAKYLMSRMNLPSWDETIIRTTIQELYMRQKHRQSGALMASQQLSTAGSVFITVFSRQLDRLMVNEAELIAGLQERYGLPVKTVRMEDMHLGQQVAILRSTALAVGVHGSALILGMFLPPGAMMIELYPYAVPAENYTPYKTMCNLPGMRLAYRSWTNRKVENNFPHPDRPPSGGGIAHLPLAEREKIVNTLMVPPHLCCRDPYWLYRIYQDTKVDLPELYATIEEAIPDALQLLDVNPQKFVQIRPGVIDTVRCAVRVPPGVDANKLTNTTRLTMEISWDEPWNGVAPEKYGIWIHQPFEEFFSPRPALDPPPCTYGSRYDIWVRSYVKTPDTGELIKSQYSEKYTCFCRPDAKAQTNVDL